MSFRRREASQWRRCRATGPPASAGRSWQREETVGTPARALYEKLDFNGFCQVKYYRKL